MESIKATWMRAEHTTHKIAEVGKAFVGEKRRSGGEGGENRKEINVAPLRFGEYSFSSFIPS